MQNGIGLGTRRVTERIEAVVTPVLWSLGLELVDIACVGQGSRTVVRVYIDKPGGVTLADCEEAHRSLSPALDVADPFPHSYTLEVSSPGADRPLRRRQDYERAIGKLVQLRLRQALRGQWRLIGRLREVDDEGIVISIIDGKNRKEVEVLPVAFDDLAECKLEVEFSRGREETRERR